MAIYLKYPYALLIFIPFAIMVVLLIRRNFLTFRNVKEQEEFMRRNRFIKRYLIVSRLLIFLLLFIALAAPFIYEERPTKGDLSITILADNSTSYSIFDTSVAEKLKDQLEKRIPTTVKAIATGDRSPIGDALLANIKGGDNILVLTDGYANQGKNLGDVILFASKLNTTVSTIDLKPIHDDTSVSIDGPSNAILGSETTFYATVTQVGNPKQYHLIVDIDGVPVLDQAAQSSNLYDFSKTLSEGYHKITAKIIIDDFFLQNNVFYKTANIIKKPKIVYITKKGSALKQNIENVYDITTQSTLPDDVSVYAAVVLDDLNEKDLRDRQVDILSNYVTDGNGLFVIGGKNSFDKGNYKDSYFETLLPARAGKGEKEEKKDISIVIVIDISGSTGKSVDKNAGPTKVDVEKALALSILGHVKGEDYVGIVAFNTDPYVVAPLAPLKQNYDTLKDRVERLQFGGGTDMTVGIEKAQELLLRAQGSRNIIIISDGITFDPLSALQSTYLAQTAGISVYTVGVGFDTYELLMKKIAEVGHGIYFHPTQEQKLKIIFGDPDEQKNIKGIVVLNANHFITQNLELSGTVQGYNQVVPKSSANLLVTTADGHPLLTVWRFGLGRVAALSSDDGAEWAGDLLNKQNSKILTRSINWVIGDVSKKGLDIVAEDTSLGKSTDIAIKSDRPPVSKDVEFVKVDKDLYKATFTPKETGFYNFLDASVAVNYNDEYGKIGLNPDLVNLVGATGGSIFKQDEIDKIVEKVKSTSQRVETQEVSLRWPFVLCALVLLLFEIMIRRLREFRKGKA